MSRSRLVNLLWIPTLASAATIGFFSIKRSPQPAKVQMKATKNADSIVSHMNSYSFLTMQLAKDKHTPAIFIAALNRQKHSLTPEGVLELANLAIENQKVTQLDVLAGMFPNLITRQWVNAALQQSDNRFLFSELLYESAAGKLKNLNYLFDPENAVVLIEQADKTGINRALLFAKTSNIILIDSDPYEPSYRRLM